jgi:hypothetical protein
LANAETGAQPPLIQPDLARFTDLIGDPGARDMAAGLRDLIA